MILRRSPDDPADLGPPETGAYRVGIFVSVRKCVVHPVGCDPIVWRVLDRHRREYAECIFQPLRRLKSAMRQQTMPTESDTQAADDPISDQQSREILPAKRK